MNRKTSPYLGVLNEKKALKEPVGTFYHPSANHYRTGLCPVGKIERTGYEFKKSSGKVINVKTTCVKDVGSNGKTSTELANKLKVNPKELESYGYSTKLETDARHKALLKAIKVISYATTKRVLVLLRIQHKAQETNATKRIYNIYDTDIKWLTNYVEKKRSTSHNKDLFKKKSVGGARTNEANANGENANRANASNEKKNINKLFKLMLQDIIMKQLKGIFDLVDKYDILSLDTNNIDIRFIKDSYTYRLSIINGIYNIIYCGHTINDIYGIYSTKKYDNLIKFIKELNTKKTNNIVDDCKQHGTKFVGRNNAPIQLV
jgi:hypothetical protein